MGSPVEKTVLPAPIDSCRGMVRNQRIGEVHIPVLQDRTVVARKKNDRIVQQAFPVEMTDDLPDTPVSLDDGIAACADRVESLLDPFDCTGD